MCLVTTILKFLWNILRDETVFELLSSVANVFSFLSFIFNSWTGQIVKTFLFRECCDCGFLAYVLNWCISRILSISRRRIFVMQGTMMASGAFVACSAISFFCKCLWYELVGIFFHLRFTSALLQVGHAIKVGVLFRIEVGIFSSVLVSLWLLTWLSERRPELLLW